jgi:opacity protein-like surface antigen
MPSRFSVLATAIALALGASAAQAAGVEDMFSIRGYGTIGGLYSSQDEADYVRDFYAQPEGAGASDSISYAVDSKTAVQVDVRFTDRLSAVVQLVSESMNNNSWDSETNQEWVPSLEWANLSYRVTDALTVRGGRIVMPFLMNSEFQKVGYANHWMRAPVELYGKVSYTSLDGADAWYKHSLGSGTNTVRVYGGMFNAEWEARESTRVNMAGFIDTYEVGSLTLRAAYQYSKLEGQGAVGGAPIRQLAGGLGFFNSTAAAQANSIAEVIENGFNVRFMTVGASYDADTWFVMGEVWKQNGSVLIPKHTSAYVSGGVRVASWTPYATVATTDVHDSDSITTRGIPAIPQTAALIGGVQALNGSFASSLAESQSTFSLGARWDVVSNIAVKAQYDYVKLPRDSGGMFINKTADFEAGKDASLFGLSVDFVF